MLGNNCATKHGECRVSAKTSIHQLWTHKRHEKQISLDMTFESFKDLYGPVPDDKVLMMVKGELKWIPKSDVRGLGCKTSGTISPYIGTVCKFRGTEDEYFYSTFKGKYLKGSMCYSDYDSALFRDEHIIKLGLEDKFTLNFPLTLDPQDSPSVQ